METFEPSSLEQFTAEMMREQLLARRLTVSLSPAWGWLRDTGRLLRVVEDENPRWYRDFCHAFPARRSRPRRGRKFDTSIKRAHTLRALSEISQGFIRSEYAQRLYPFVARETKRLAGKDEEWVAKHWW